MKSNNFTIVIKLTAILFSLFLITSCGYYYPQKYNNVNKFKIGEDFQDFTKKYDDYFNKEKIQNFKIENKEYKVVFMKIMTEKIDVITTETKTTPATYNHGYYTPSYTTNTSNHDYRLGETPYLCIFENDKLFYWAFPYEFKRTTNQKLLEIYNHIIFEK